MRNEKITILLATVKEREETLKIVLNSILKQLDNKLVEIHLVLNYYTCVPTINIQSEEKRFRHLLI